MITDGRDFSNQEIFFISLSLVSLVLLTCLITQTAKKELTKILLQNEK